MTTPARLSTCSTCRGTIEQRTNTPHGWAHVVDTLRNAGHWPQPDDGAVSGPASCEWCGAVLEYVDDPVDACEPDCDCPPCETERALDDDADAYAGRLED